MKLKLHSFASLAAVVIFATANSSHASVIDLGATYAPAGANYTISAVQDINAANPAGVSGLGSGLFINQNVENYGALGVTYTVGSGAVSAQPGINLYNNGLTAGIQSTGLLYSFTPAGGVAASSASVTLLDFDMKSATAYGANTKAQPQISLFTPGGTMLGTASSATILTNSTFSTVKDGSLTVNMGTLLGAIGLSDQAIGSYLISAANFSGASLKQFTTANDPFFVGSASNGTPLTAVPEASALWPLLGVLGLVVVGPRLRRKLITA
jgi:hypothetical protein